MTIDFYLVVFYIVIKVGSSHKEGLVGPVSTQQGPKFGATYSFSLGTKQIYLEKNKSCCTSRVLKLSHKKTDDVML